MPTLIFYLFCLLLCRCFFLCADITVSGSPGTLAVTSAVAGSQPTSVTNTSTTYAITTLLTSTVVGSVNTAMPSGVTLAIQLAAPPFATSAGFVTMTTTPTNLVTGIPILTNQSNLMITYRLSATVNASQVTNATRTVTFTQQ